MRISEYKKDTGVQEYKEGHGDTRIQGKIHAQGRIPERIPT